MVIGIETLHFKLSYHSNLSTSNTTMNTENHSDASGKLTLGVKDVHGALSVGTRLFQLLRRTKAVKERNCSGHHKIGLLTAMQLLPDGQPFSPQWDGMIWNNPVAPDGLRTVGS
jgi:hypothetical protein